TAPAPALTLCLLGRPPRDVCRAAPPGASWDVRWVRWPDFLLPRDRAGLQRALLELRERAGTERVEIACGGGRGRTGTALALLAVLDGVPARDAVAFVRGHYHPRAVETPWQHAYVRRFTAAPGPGSPTGP
ncbi:protein-tyrosine phosphatase family protein, partial [Streptomyces clavuligerus]|uniref:protein-tyrosine phosphatase family protein n=4 Tax=Streptomyces clavuligerus TaxID=1901 RepID=UPI0018D10E7B